MVAREGLIIAIVLAIFISLTLLTVAGGGLKQNSIGEMYNPNGAQQTATLKGRTSDAAFVAER